MNELLTALWNGLHVAASDWQLVLGIVLIVVWGQFVLYSILNLVFESKLSAAEYFSLSLSGWLLPAALLSFIWYLFGLVFTLRIGTWIGLSLGTLFAVVLFVQSRKQQKSSSRAILLSLPSLMLLFMILRLAFVKQAVFPSYFDSAQHYLHIKGLLVNLQSADSTSVVPLSFTTYYHLGFHFLATLITSITGAQITDVMLMLGQIILALMPFFVFFFIKHETGSGAAAMLALALAAFGWYMPAHAVDWGKYPALASIALLPFVMCVMYLLIRYQKAVSSRHYWILGVLLLAGFAVTVILHSRSLIVFAILALTWMLTFLWQKLRRWLKVIFFCLAVAVLMLEILFIQTKGILGPLFDPYISKGLIVTLAVLLLSIFAYGRYSHWLFGCILVIDLLLASLFVPLRDLIPGYANMTLLDRPFVEMILYLPLTLAGGLGLAGLEEKLTSSKIAPRQIQLSTGRIPAMLFIALVAVHALYTYDLYPSDCCTIVSSDDVAAIEWMDKNLPPDARVLTASSELNVLPTTEFQGSANGDAGAWIQPITGRTSVPMIFYADFSDPATLGTLCQLGVRYVYVGATGWPFDDSTMPEIPNGYSILLALPKAKVYQVTGCN